MGITALNLKRERSAGSEEERLVLSAMDKPVEQRLVTPARATAAVSAACLIGLSAYSYTEFGLHRTLSIDPARLTISTVRSGTFHDYIPVTGNVVPRNSVYLDAVEGGQVTQVYVEAGAYVKAGEPILRLKNTDLQLQVIGREAQAAEQLNNLSSTSLAFEQNRLQHRRDLIDIEYRIQTLSRHIAQRRRLVETGGAAKGEVDDMRAQLGYYKKERRAVAEAQAADKRLQAVQIQRLQDAIDALNKNLAIARQNLESLVVKAPIAGRLTSLQASVGESKTPGERIGQIDEFDAFKVSALIDEFYLPRVASDEAATADVDGKRYALKVAKIYPDVQDRQFKVDLVFRGDAPPMLRRGQTVRLRLEIGAPAKSLVLANGAFYDDTGGRWVFVVGPHGKYAAKRSVRLGRRNPQGIEVLGGLRAGERVITSSYENLTSFDRIRLRGGLL